MEMMSLCTIENLLLVPIGIVIATFATFVGIGGGLLWAPYLVVIRRLDPQTAIMVSFLIQIGGMGSATVANIRRHSIYWRLALTLLPTIAAGIVVGAFLNRLVPTSRWIEMGLGVLSIVMSLFFTFYTEPYDVRMELDRSLSPPRWLRGLSVLFGTVSGFFSIGVSDLLVPIIRSKLRVPMPFAIGTKLFLNFALACTGGAVYLVLDHERVTYSLLAIIGFGWIGVLIGGQLGPYLSEKIGDEKLKELFIFALLLIGMHLIYQAL